MSQRKIRKAAADLAETVAAEITSSTTKKLKQSHVTGKSLMWFRTDLRTMDNPALRQASVYANTNGGGTVGLFIVSPEEWFAHDMAPVKVDLILRHLRTLRQDLAERFGIPLIVECIPKAKDVPAFVASTALDWGMDAVFLNQEYEVNESKRDAMVADLLSKKNIELHSFHDQCILPPGTLFTKAGKPYTVFTPFKNTWYKAIEADLGYVTPHEKPVANDSSFLTFAEQKSTSSSPCPIVASWTDSYFNETLKETIESKIQKALATYFPMDDVMAQNLVQVQKDWPVGEQVAQTRLDKYIEEKIRNYKHDRDFPHLDRTSRLSAYLAIGAVSARTCIHRAISANHGKWSSGSEGIVCWISELCWRDFYRHVLFHFPHVCRNQPFKLDTKKIQWRVDEGAFEAWCRGETGYPFVDAGMKQLVATGWMHNRLRMVVAMFLTKHLLLDWRKGEKFFMKHLIDGDFASNNGGWQWSASTGTDAQPYFRVFAPTTQAERFDKEGTFIRKWIPALALVDKKAIHAPHAKLPGSVFHKLGYPEPIVEHSFARKRAIAAFDVLKKDK